MAPRAAGSQRTKGQYAGNIGFRFSDCRNSPRKYAVTPWIATTTVWDLNRNTGNLQWQTVLGTSQSLHDPDVEEVGNALIGQHTVYLGNPFTETIAALSLTDGHVLWQHPVNGLVSAPPVWDGQRLWLVTSTGWVMLTNRHGVTQAQWHSPWGNFGPGSPVIGKQGWCAGTLSGWFFWMPYHFAAP